MHVFIALQLAVTEYNINNICIALETDLLVYMGGNINARS